VALLVTDTVAMAQVRKAFHRARRGNAHCVYGTTKGDTRVRGEFDLIMSAQKHGCGSEADAVFGVWNTQLAKIALTLSLRD
jgi:hypothetical protein